MVTKSNILCSKKSRLTPNINGFKVIKKINNRIQIEKQIALNQNKLYEINKNRKIFNIFKVIYKKIIRIKTHNT